MSATQESNRDIVRQHLAAFNDRDKEAFSDLLADDVVEHGIHEKLERRGDPGVSGPAMELRRVD